MSAASAALEQFHISYEIPNSVQQKLLRLKLIEEEFLETKRELEEDYIDKKLLAKELADLLYVTYGTAYVWGIDLDIALREVHRSNMSKLGEDGKPIRRKDGKILKGPNYFEPDMSLAILNNE